MMIQIIILNKIKLYQPHILLVKNVFLLFSLFDINNKTYSIITEFKNRILIHIKNISRRIMYFAPQKNVNIKWL